MTLPHRRHSAGLAAAALLAAGIAGPAAALAPDSVCSGSSFFDCFSFISDNDPTHGYVDYQTSDQAKAANLTGINGANQVYMKADDTAVGAGRGRKSIRVQSTATFTTGLFVLDLAHMPAGCGTWPAFWLLGLDSPWPNAGEIDILEGWNIASNALSTLHTSTGCEITTQQGVDYSGYTVSKNCYIYAGGQPSNEGCQIVGPHGSYGDLLNQAGGGVFVTDLSDQGIRMWFFNHGAVPADVSQPDTYGVLPYAAWSFGTDCTRSHFSAQHMIFDLTFCGDISSQWPLTCSDKGNSCSDYVRDNPSAFSEAYWLVNSLEVYNVASEVIHI